MTERFLVEFADGTRTIQPAGDIQTAIAAARTARMLASYAAPKPLPQAALVVVKAELVREGGVA